MLGQNDSSKFLSNEVWHIVDTMPGGVVGVSHVWELVKRLYVLRGAEAVTSLRTAFAALATYMTQILESAQDNKDQLSPKVDTFIQSILNTEHLCFTSGDRKSVV